MNRVLKGLPMAESELYKRRNTLLKGCKGMRRCSTLANYVNRKRNVGDNQSSSDYNERFAAPVPTEYFSTSTVAHQATRRRVLSVYKSTVAKENAHPQLF